MIDRKTTFAVLAGALLGAAFIGAASADNTPPASAAKLDGETLYTDYACSSCHGTAGRNGLPGYPILAGQDEAYLVEQLHAFKKGERANGMAQTMIGIAQPLSDDEMVAIAHYLSKLGGKK